MRNKRQGFTLTELAVVLAIIGLLIASGMFTLQAQVDQRNFEETRRRLVQARELVLAYAIVNGRLPCPATSATSGQESPAGGGTCTAPYDGLLPARTIGHADVNEDGFALDAWGNPIRYAVSAAAPLTSASPPVCRPGNPPAAPQAIHFTHKDNLRNNGIDCQPSDLLICKSSTGMTGSACGGAANQIVSQNLIAAIVFSTGKNHGTTGGIGNDEKANLKTLTTVTPQVNPVFVYHTPAPSSALNGEFDDQFVWITAGELYGRLIAAGVIP